MNQLTLSRSCIPFFRLNDTDIFRLFLKNELVSVDGLIGLAETLERKSVHFKTRLRKLEQNQTNIEQVYDIILAEVEKNYTLNEIMKLLFLNGRHVLVKKLFWYYYELGRGVRTIDVPKINVCNRGNVTAYFIQVKNFVHARVFKTPYEHVKQLGNMVKLKIDITKDPRQQQLLCDKFIALKAIEYDAGSNVSALPNEQDKTFKDMEEILDKTSFPSLSRVLLYGRKADAMSTLRMFADGEKMLTEAYVCADLSHSCLEIVDMIYKGVVFKLSHFEQNTTEELQEEIMFDAHRALNLLSQEHEDDQKFWKILLLIRMVFALLGIGKQCRIIRNYFPSRTQLKQAEHILTTINFKQIDHRKQMFYLTAKARILEFNNQMEWCIYYLQRAMILAIIGNYSEKKFINEYGELLGKDFTYLFECVYPDTPPMHINPSLDENEVLIDLPSTSDYTPFTSSFSDLSDSRSFTAIPESQNPSSASSRNFF